RCRRFARNHEPLSVDIMIDRQKSRKVVRDLGLQLLGSPYRPLRSSQRSQHVWLRTVVEHEDDELPYLGRRAGIRNVRTGELSYRRARAGSRWRQPREVTPQLL